MRIALGSDHAGFRYKRSIVRLLEGLHHEITDFGTDSDDPVDYPFFILRAAEAVGKRVCDRGIVIGGSGNGEAIVANKVPGIRCALCWNEESAALSRKHNDANVLSLGARMITERDAHRIVQLWLETPFEGGRHLRRVHQIAEIEARLRSPS